MAADRLRGMSPGALVAWTLALAAGALAASAGAQAGAQAGAAEGAVASERGPVGSEEAPKDPYVAYESGHFDRALEGFANAQVARPEDPVVHLNLGSTYYKLDDYEAAEREYDRAATAEDEVLRAEALYNLGNAAYRQGRLEDAIAHYRSALEIDSDDQDAKYNLEFVQRELERQQQQQQQDQQQDQEQEQERGQDEQTQQQDRANQESQENPEDQESQQSEQPEGEPDTDAPEPRDSDQDGLPDQVERRGRNPTDPQNPDTDGDGRTDGEEDTNANGQVDPGESDPNVADQAPLPQESAAEGAAAESQDPTGMSPEQAERFLQGLEEERPEGKQARGRVKRLEKDW